MSRNVIIITSMFLAILFSLVVSSTVGADVVNGSNKVVHVKLENSSGLQVVHPGTIFKGRHDGVIANGKVYKTSDGIDVAVGADGVVRTLSMNPVTLTAEAVRAGELRSEPDGTWGPAFREAWRQEASVKSKGGVGGNSIDGMRRKKGNGGCWQACHNGL